MWSDETDWSYLAIWVLNEEERRSMQAREHNAHRQAWWWKHNVMGMLLLRWHREHRQGPSNHENGGLHQDS